MAKRISSLSVTLGANSAPFSRGMRKAEADLSSFQRMTSAASATLMKFGGVLAGAFAVGSVVGGIRSAADEIDRIGKAALSLGVTTEAMAGLEHAAKLSGVEAGNLTASMSRLLNVVGEASNGSKAAQASLAALGFTAADLQRLTPDQMLGRIADRVMAIEDPARRAAAMIDIFGRSGVQLLPMLAQGSAGLAAMQKEAERLGLTFSQADFAAVEQMNDSVTRLGQSWQGLTREMAAAVAPAVTTWFSDLTETMVRLRKAQELTAGGTKDRAAAVASAFGGSTDGYLDRLIELDDAAKGVADAMRAIESAQKSLDAARGMADAPGDYEGMIKARQAELAAIDEMVRAVGQLAGAGTAADMAGVLGPKARASIEAWRGHAKGLREEGDVIKRTIEDLQRYVSAGSDGAWTFALPNMKDAARQFEDAQRQAERLKETLRTPAETFDAEIARLNGLLQMGLLDVETYERAVKAAQETLDASRGAGTWKLIPDFGNAMDALQDMQREADRVRESVATPAERLQTELDKLGALVNSGAIDWQTYERAIDKAHESFGGLDRDTRAASSTWTAMLAGSAEAMQLAAQSQFAQLTANVTANPAPTPAPLPVPRAAMAKDDNASGKAQVDVLQQIRDLLRDNPRIEFTQQGA